MKWRASSARDVLRSARGQNRGARVELLRRAALLADAENDVATATQARTQIVDLSLSINAEADMLAAFAWLLQTTKGNHDDAPFDDMLWRYKWAAATLPDFASISSDLIRRAIDDLEAQYAVNGLSTAAAVQLRLEVGTKMRLHDRLPELFEAWQQNESGAGSDCAACRRDIRVRYFFARGDHKRVVLESAPFRDGSLRCSEVPGITFPIMAFSLHQIGRTDEADRMCQQGLAWLARQEKTPEDIGLLMTYLALRNRTEEGLALVTSWARRALLTRNDARRLSFLSGAAMVLNAMRAAGVGVVSLTLPPFCEAFEKDGLYDVARLCEYFDNETGRLAARFDARNGNAGVSQELQSARGVLDQAC